MADRPSRAALAGIVLAHLPALLPLSVCVPFSLGGLVLVSATAWAALRVFQPGWARVPASVLLATFVGFVWIFAKGTGSAAVLLLPLIPAGLLLGIAAATKSVDVVRGAPLTVAVLVVLGTLVSQRFLEPSVVPPLTDDFFYALRADPVPEPLTEEERGAAMALVDSVLRGSPEPVIPERLKDAPDGRVYVTIFRRSKRSNWTRGQSSADTIAAAIREASADAWANAPRKSAWTKAKEDLRVVVDLAGPEYELGGRWLRGLAGAVYKPFAPSWSRWRFLVYDGEPGVDGFRIEKGEREGVVLPGDQIYFGWTTPRDRKKRYRDHNLAPLEKALHRRAGLPKDPIRPPGSRLFNFRSYAFARPDPASKRTVELYRANVLQPDLPDIAAVIDGIDRAGAWLLGTVEDDGRFDYEYFPNRDDHGRGYNEVRHAGSVYGLFHLVHLARSEPALAKTSDAYLDAGLTALDRVYDNLGPAPGTTPEEGYVAFLEGKGGKKTNSGAAALTLLSFLERPTAEDTDDPALAARIRRDGDDAIMAGLVKTLLAMIDDRGWVYAKWTDARDDVVMEREPLYYPGEAMLALARYHDQVGSPEALEGAKAIGRRQVALLDRFWSLPDHWVMQALDVLDRLDPENPLWRGGGYEMADRFVGDQSGDPGSGLRHPAPFPDYRGAYRRIQEVPRTTRAAARGEAVGGIARIAWRHGDPAEHLEASLLEGARHLMEQMYTPDNSFFFKDPDEVQGAIRMGIIDNHVRIDNNQHGVVALGNALQVLRRREAAP